MVAITRLKEKCHGCSKNILKHNQIVICQYCQKIVHGKCAQKLYNFDHLSDAWSCWECTSVSEKRYNPFNSILQYNKHAHDDSESFDDLKKIDHLLDNCKAYNYEQINELFGNYDTSISIFYNNIDGVTSNFDNLSSELSALNKKFSIIALSETNMDASNKDLFILNGYQSIYQSKVASKRKGSGVGMYISD